MKAQLVRAEEGGRGGQKRSRSYKQEEAEQDP